MVSVDEKTLCCHTEETREDCHVECKSAASGILTPPPLPPLPLLPRRNGAQWIPLCRAKLKVCIKSRDIWWWLILVIYTIMSICCGQEREMELIQNRQTACFRIIEHSMEQFGRQNQKCFMEQHGITTVRVQRMDQVNHEQVAHHLGPTFWRHQLESCSVAIYGSLNHWSGVSKSRKFKKIDTIHFNEYFKTAKNWFDQRKVELLSDLYWTPLFTAIDQVWF